jgi:hypothetical protein
MSKDCVSRVLALAIALSACKSTNSENVRTPGIAVDYRVTDNQFGTVSASAVMKIGSTYIDLSGGDALYCEGVKMGKAEGGLREVMYAANLNRLVPGDSYEFQLYRPATRETHFSYAIAPEPVVITAPSSGESVSSRLPLSVVWTAAAQGNMSVHVTGSSVRSQSNNVGLDRGSYTIPANTLVCEDNLIWCAGTLTVTRTIVGVGDPDFESATVESITEARVDIQIQM